MFAHLRKTQLASQHCVGSLAGRRLSNVMAANRHNMFFLHIVTINRYISSANIVMDSVFQCRYNISASFFPFFISTKQNDKGHRVNTILQSKHSWRFHKQLSFLPFSHFSDFLSFSFQISSVFFLHFSRFRAGGISTVDNKF